VHELKGERWKEPDMEEEEEEDRGEGRFNQKKYCWKVLDIFWNTHYY